jgi:hypothetical protein
MILDVVSLRGATLLETQVVQGRIQGTGVRGRCKGATYREKNKQIALSWPTWDFITVFKENQPLRWRLARYPSQ